MLKKEGLLKKKICTALGFCVSGLEVYLRSLVDFYLYVVSNFYFLEKYYQRTIK